MSIIVNEKYVYSFPELSRDAQPCVSKFDNFHSKKKGLTHRKNKHKDKKIMYLFETINRLIVLFSIRKSQSSLQKGGVHEFFTVNETIISNNFNVNIFLRNLFDNFYALFRRKILLSFN